MTGLASPVPSGREMAMRGAIADAARRLSAVSTTPRLDAELLMAHALGLTREHLLLSGMAEPAHSSFAALVERRAAGEPVAYLTGRRGFWTIELDVSPAVLIPRADSETLIEAAVSHFAGSRGPRRVLDLGTGSGALLLAALDQWPDSSGIGVDRSAEALDVARCNAVRLGMDDRAEFRLGDWAAEIDQAFDLVLCNPPYVAEAAELGPGVREHEPAGALFAGPDGLAAYRVLARQIGRLIAPGGLAAIEIGADQAHCAAALFAASGSCPAVAADLGGRPRALLIAKPADFTWNSCRLPLHRGA